MNALQTSYFVQFLKRQKDLSILSLNCSIDIGSSPTAFAAFLSSVKTLPLRSLSLQSDGSMPFSFGQLLAPLFKEPFMRLLEHLDVTNQCIGEAGLDILGQLLDRAEISDLSFDGAAPRTFDYLTRFCETILSSRLRFASFPAQDFDKLFRLFPAADDPLQRAELRDELRRRFEAAYGAPPDRAERIRQISTNAIARRPSDPATFKVRKLQRSSSVADGDLHLPDGLADARRMSERQELLFRECIDPDDTTDDPVVELMKTIQDSLTLAAILAGPP
jgi:hypothetical protein